LRSGNTIPEDVNDGEVVGAKINDGEVGDITN